MQPTQTKNQLNSNYIRIACVAIATTFLGIAQSHAASLFLTGLTEFSTTSEGLRAGDVWDTTGGFAGPGGSPFNLYVSQGGSAAPFINSGNDDSVRISIELIADSDYTLTFRGSFGVSGAAQREFYGLNLFFNLDDLHPQISVFAPVQIDAVIPPFTANSSDTVSLDGSTPVPGSGSLFFDADEKRVTLTSYQWAVPTVENVDRIGTYSADPNGIDDYVGRITLHVGPIPEPTTGVLVMLSLVGFASSRRRASKAVNE